MMEDDGGDIYSNNGDVDRGPWGWLWTLTYSCYFSRAETFISLKHFFIIFIYVHVRQCTFRGAHGEIKGILWELAPSYHVGFRDGIQVARLGGKCLYGMSHLYVLQTFHSYVQRLSALTLQKVLSCYHIQRWVRLRKQCGLCWLETELELDTDLPSLGFHLLDLES